jgi:hypothetical protein
MFFQFLTPPSEPEPIAVAQLRGYKLETIPCPKSGCTAPYHSRLTYLDPWSGDEVGRCAHIWDHSTFLVAVSGHHRIVRALSDQAGPDWDLATRQTCAGGGVRVEALFGEKPALPKPLIIDVGPISPGSLIEEIRRRRFGSGGL